MRVVADYALILLVATLLAFIVRWLLPTTADDIRFMLVLIPAAAFAGWLGTRRAREDKE